MRLFCRILVVLAVLPDLPAVPVRVLVIGDSMSEEYANEIPFSAPDSNPSNPNTENWVEILDDRRATHLDFGSDGVYPDLRALGFKYNWGFPGATSDFWVDVLNSSFWDHPEYLTSKIALLDQVDNSIDVVVLFVGGNDVSSDYGNLYNNSPSPGLISDFLTHIAFIIDTLRADRTDLPVVLVNVPDVGATPDIQEDHPDPAKRADATAHIVDLNAQLANLAAEKNVQLVDLFAITARIIEPGPIVIGPVPMIKSYDRENRPNYLFCKEKFHPASGASALIGNAILDGINTLPGIAITPLTEHEIAAEVLGLQAYLDWVGTFPGADPNLLADDDHDGLPSIGEFALQHHPQVFDRLPAPAVSGRATTLSFSPDPSASDLVETIPEESTDLETWSPIPPGRRTKAPNGQINAQLAPGTQAFARLRFILAP